MNRAVGGHGAASGGRWAAPGGPGGGGGGGDGDGDLGAIVISSAEIGAAAGAAAAAAAVVAGLIGDGEGVAPVGEPKIGLPPGTHKG